MTPRTRPRSPRPSQTGRRRPGSCRRSSRSSPRSRRPVWRQWRVPSRSSCLGGTESAVILDRASATVCSHPSAADRMARATWSRVRASRCPVRRSRSCSRLTVSSSFLLLLPKAGAWACTHPITRVLAVVVGLACTWAATNLACRPSHLTLGISSVSVLPVRVRRSPRRSRWSPRDRSRGAPVLP